MPPLIFREIPMTEETKRNKVTIHKSGSYRYACTQPSYIDPKTNTRKYRRIHWGTVDENNRFYPNRTYIEADPGERESLLFPSDWDLSEIEMIRMGEQRVIPLHERRTRALRVGVLEPGESSPQEEIPSGKMILRLIDRLEKEEIPSDKILEIVKSMGEG